MAHTTCQADPIEWVCSEPPVEVEPPAAGRRRRPELLAAVFAFHRGLICHPLGITGPRDLF